MHPSAKNLIRSAALSAVGLGLLAGSASADGLVYAKGGNVWLANADGTGEYQVTLDGSPGQRYKSPSQADDGTIVALRSGRLFRMKQNGKLLNVPIATAAPGSGPLHPAVSPDGRLVAFDYITAIPRPPSQGGGFKTETIYTYSDRLTQRTEIDPAGFSFTDPSWLDNGRTVLFYGQQVWTDTLDPSDETLWFSDSDHGDAFEQLQDGEAAAGKVVLVRGANRQTIQLYDRAPSDSSSLPQPSCYLSEPNGEFVDPTLTPDGGTLAWQENDGVWVMPVPASGNCTGTPRLAIPGASEPDFAPANVNPGPREVDPPLKPDADKVAPKVALKLKGKVKLSALLRGLRVPYTCSETCSARGTLAQGSKTVGTGSRPAAASGTLVVKLGTKAKRRLRRSRVVRLTLTVRVQDAAGNAGSVKRKLAVSR